MVPILIIVATGLAAIPATGSNYTSDIISVLAQVNNNNFIDEQTASGSNTRDTNATSRNMTGGLGTPKEILPPDLNITKAG